MKTMTEDCGNIGLGSGLEKTNKHMKTMTEDCGNIGLGSGLAQRGSQTK